MKLLASHLLVVIIAVLACSWSESLEALWLTSQTFTIIGGLSVMVLTLGVVLSLVASALEDAGSQNTMQVDVEE